MKQVPGWLRSSRGRLVALLGAVLLAVVLTVAVVVAGGGGEPSPRAGGPSATAAPTSSGGAASPSSSSATDAAVPPAPATPAAGATDDATGRPPELAPVALDAPSSAAGGVTARLTLMEPVQGDAGEGIGEIDGPALRVTVELTNDGDAPLPLDGVAVELYSGADLRPAPPLDDPSQQPFSGTVAPGVTGSGVYVFRIPVADRDDVTVLVEPQAGAPFMVFHGNAS